MISICFQASQPLDAVKLFYLAQQLALLAGREVDLVDLLSTTTVMCAEIIHTGKLIYTADTFKSDMFAATAFSKYAHFNERRQPILDAIKERGSIYGV